MITLTHKDPIMAALNHKHPDRKPIDFVGYPSATSSNVVAYKKVKEDLDSGTQTSAVNCQPIKVYLNV